MSDQSNSAAERSAHVTRGEKPAPAEWPVVRMPNGTWKLKSVVALEARIAKLETHLEERKMNSGLVWCICSEADDRIKELKARIAELEAALSAAAEDIGIWGSQASQYSQEKWDLEGDVKRYIAIAEGKLPYRARHPMETWKDE